MAGHAYKRSVDDLDGGFGRELVRTWFARNVRDGADLIVRMGRIARPSRSR
jgi:elongation factor P hydroxylase